MIAPTERSMPAVRITSVWAMPRVPTTITCWTTSERFAGSRKRSVVRLKYSDREQQDEQRPERRVAVQDVMDAGAQRGFPRRPDGVSRPAAARARGRELSEAIGHGL